MIYTFDAVRTITARIVVEAPTAEEAEKALNGIALQNSDYPWVEEESIRLRAAYETWEGASIAEKVTQPRFLHGTPSQVKVFEKPLLPEEINKHFMEI